MKKLILTLITSVVLAGFTFHVAAADPAPADKPGKAKASVTAFRGTVSAVDKSAKTLTVKNQDRERVLAVGAETRITKNGKPATLEDAVAGDYASGSYTAKAERMELRVLNLGKPPVRKKAKE